jgi:hypothetical protein
VTIEKDQIYSTVYFQAADWGTNLAKEVMELIKTYPEEQRQYYGITKKWKVSRKTSFEKDVQILLDKRSANRVPYGEQVDIQEFMDQFNL